MEYNYKTQGVCSREIILDIDDDDRIISVRFIGGCNGNLKGVSTLVSGMKMDEVIEKLKDIECGNKGTSCPAQLAKALMEIKEER